MKPLIQLDKVGVCYKQRIGILRKKLFWALDDVSFTLEKGQTLGVIGRNGIGKTTLLKLLAGIINPDRGNITRNLKTASMMSLQLGFQPDLSGRENAILSGLLMGVPKNKMLDSMDEIIEFSELGEFFDQPIKTYSAGMRARLGFSTAMQTDPDLLLIDEVLGVGDQAFREKSTRLIKQRVTSNKTVILVSHDMGTIRELCDSVLWMENRSSRRQGSTDEILAAYLHSTSSD